MATGSLLSAIIDRTGLYAYLKFEGLAAGGAYNFGTLPASPRVTIAVTSEGYSGAGVLGTVARNVYGTNHVLLPYPAGTAAPATGTWYIVQGAVTLNGRRGFENGETVTQAGTAATALVSTDCPCAPLVIHTVTGTPNSSGVWTGGTSGATMTPTTAPTTYAYGAKREGVDGSDLWVAVALHSKIHDDDRNGGAGTSGTDPAVTLVAGAYGASLAATAVAATNLSGLDYPKAIARWAVVPKQRFTGSFALECEAFHGHGIACVQFAATDGTNTPTIAPTTAMSRSTRPDALPVYASALSATDFAVRSVVTCNFTAYPRVGDANSVTTTVGGTTQPSATLGPLPLLADKDNTYGVTVAYVDSSTGNDTTGVADDIANTATAAASPCLTIKGAITKISAYNNTNRTRNSCDAGVVYLKTGNHAYGDGTATGNAQTTWLTVTRAPGLANRAAVINARSATYLLGPDLIRIYDLDIDPPSADNLNFNGAAGDTIWLDGNRITGAGTSTNPLCTAFGVAYFTDNTSDLVYSPLHLSGGGGLPLQRNNNVQGVNFGVQGGLCIVGNTIRQRTASGNYAVQTTAALDNEIIAYNSVRVIFEGMIGPTAPSQGLAVIGNLWEKTGANTNPLITLFADGNTNAANHVIFDHNTVAGQRTNWAYRDVLAGGVKTNLFHRYNSEAFLAIKHDNFTGTEGNDGRRAYGAGESEYGVDHWGNNSERGYSGDPLGADGFPPNYSGVNGTRATQAGYTADASRTGTDAGGGNYTPATGSVLRNKIPSGWSVLAYDKAGTAINNAGTGAAGAIQPAPTSGRFRRIGMGGGMAELTGGLN